MTLAEMCEAALQEIGWAVPASFIGNSDDDAVQCVALANRTGRQLSKTVRWEYPLKTYTFSTVNGTLEYALPSDFQSFAFMTEWDRTNYEKMLGPATPAQWQELNSGLITVTTVRWFRISESKFRIYPTPTTADTIAYEYYSNQWCESSAGTGQTSFAADTDVSLLDDDLMTMGIKWRFLKAKGQAYQEELREYEQLLASCKADDGDRGIIRFGGGFNRDPLPDTGFGQ